MTRVKRLICFGLLLALLAGPIALAFPEGTEAASETEEAATQENSVAGDTLLATMLIAAREGTPAALAEGADAEVARNLTLSEQGLPETAFFGSYETSLQTTVAIADYMVAMGITEVEGEPVQFRIVASSKNLRAAPDREYERVGSIPHGTIVTFLGRSVNGWLKVTDGTLSGWGTAIHLAPFDGTTAPIWWTPGSTIAGEIVPMPDATHDDLFWLALTIELEAGSAWLTDEHQLLVGNVVLNRVAHPRFPSTIFDVIHQPGQYPWAAPGVRVPISDRAWANAERLMAGERFAPPNVVFQAKFTQGDGTFAYFHCSVLENTTFFGYLLG